MYKCLGGNIDIYIYVLFSVKLNISLVITLTPCNRVTKICHLFTITSLAKHYEGFAQI